MDRASGRVGRRALRPAVHEFGSRSPGASLLTASVCTRGLRLTRRIVTRVCGPRLNFLRTAGACEGGAGRGEFILKHDRGSHSSRWLIPNCRRVFGAHAPHPTPENPHPTTAISWGPRDLAALRLPPHEIFDFAGTLLLRSSAQAHDLPPHEIFDFARTPGLGHLATESFAANRNQASGRFDRRGRFRRAIARGRACLVRRGERAPRDGGEEGASSVAVAVAAGRSVRRR